MNPTSSELIEEKGGMLCQIKRSRTQRLAFENSQCSSKMKDNYVTKTERCREGKEIYREKGRVEGKIIIKVGEWRFLKECKIRSVYSVDHHISISNPINDYLDMYGLRL